MAEASIAHAEQNGQASEVISAEAKQDVQTSEAVSPRRAHSEGSLEPTATADSEGSTVDRKSQQARKTQDGQKRVSYESFSKVCDLLYGKKVRVRRQVAEQSESSEELVEGLLRKAQGRSSVKVLTEVGDAVLIRIEDIASLEAPDGTCIVPVQVATTTKGSESKGYSTDASAPKAALSRREKHLPGGLKIEVEKEGPSGGRKASNGDDVQMYYDGRLVANGRRFDKGTFSFKLGCREVIKGMDLGVEGMVVGEKRKITIPWKMAYGAEGSPPTIPPRADLEFSVVLNALS